eukprot:1770754-Pleurochrysis_carterae.AAC.5
MGARAQVAKQEGEQRHAAQQVRTLTWTAKLGLVGTIVAGTAVLLRRIDAPCAIKTSDSTATEARALKGKKGDGDREATPRPVPGSKPSAQAGEAPHLVMIHLNTTNSAPTCMQGGVMLA